MNARAARTGGALAAAVLAMATATGDHDVRGWPPGMRVQSPDEIPQLVRARRGQPVLVALYASWCDDCVAELPVIDDVDARYRARGLSVLAISLDDDPDDFAAMMRRPPRSLELVRAAPVDERVVADSMRRLGATWTGSIPYVALFDVSGKLLREWPPGDATQPQLGTAIEEILDRPMVR